MQDSLHDADLPGKLPAYWPAACLGGSMDDLPTDISLSPDADPLNYRHMCEADEDSPRADSQGGEGGTAGAGKQHLKTYAELLSEETAAMKNAVGPWQPRLEKSSKLMVSVSCMHGMHLTPLVHQHGMYRCVCMSDVYSAMRMH